jgi:hypothetical protein
MSTKVTSEKMTSFEVNNTTFCKESSVITNPIEFKCISKVSKSNLTMSSAVKAGLVFFATVGGYYLAKTTSISYFGQKGKNLNSKDVSKEIMEVINEKKSLSIRRNLKTTEQINNPFINHIVQTHESKERAVEFEEIEIKEFEDLSKVKEGNVIERRSISVKNPIPNQNIAVGKLFNLTIDGTYVFNSSDAVFLEAMGIPAWLTSSNLNPTFKGSYDTLNCAYEVVVSGNYAYVASDGSGLQIIDISDPANPTFKGSYDTWGSFGVAVSGNYAYVADADSGLQIIDISDPSNPNFKGSYNSTVSDIALFENYAYVTYWDNVNYVEGFGIIDISDPSNPTFKGSYNNTNVEGLAISENYAYVINWGPSLQIVDVSNPSNPTFKGSFNTPGLAFGVTVSSNYAYVADYTSGLQIVNISDPSNPTFKGSYDMSENAQVVALSGNYAYVADESRLQIIDISDPSNPTFKSSYDMPASSQIERVAFSKNYAYVADGNSGLQIINSNLDKLILSGTPTFAGTYHVNIKACNEIMECASNNFSIIVTDLTITFVIIGSITGAICTVSFCCTLIGGGIIAFKRSRNKILRDNININVKEKEKLLDKKSKKFLSMI